MGDETNFAKGPWEVEFWKSGNTFHVNGQRDSVAGYRFTICSLIPGLDKEANANLIAAAPELYEACQAALNMVDTDQGPPNWDMLRAAIAKARGEK